MTATVTSKNRVPIRLTDERWIHISEEHSELAGMRLEVLEAIADPVRIYQFVEKRSHAVILSEAKNLLLLFSSTYEILRRLRLLGMTD